MEHGASTTTRQAHYYVPQPMPWPIIGAFALFCMALGTVVLSRGSARHRGTEIAPARFRAGAIRTADRQRSIVIRTERCSTAPFARIVARAK